MGQPLRGVAMQNGFLYEIIVKIIVALNYLNLVELFKCVARRLTTVEENKKASINIAIDIFIVMKWVLIIIFWANQWSEYWYSFVAFYLIAFNLHTYFYYHIWEDRAITNVQISIERVKRRFVNLILAIAFSTVCYAYLYAVCFRDQFTWAYGVSTNIAAIQYSMANIFGGSNDIVKPNTDIGEMILISQLIVTFLFITIIMSRSIPQFEVKE
jgi:hypothetical protein